MINASESQLWSGLAHLEISFRKKDRAGEQWEGGGGDASTSLARQTKAESLYRGRMGSEGERELENRGGR